MLVARQFGHEMASKVAQDDLRAAITRERILDLEAAKAADIENSGDGLASYEVDQASNQTREICEVQVLGLSGLLTSLPEAELSWSGLELKKRIAAKMRIPVSEQRLFLEDVELADDEPVSSVVSPKTPTAEVLLVRSETDVQWLEMMNVAGMQLAVAPPAVQADRAIVLAAVRQNGQALEYAAEELQADYEVVKSAVRQSGTALAHCAPELRFDFSVVMEAVSCDGRALEFASPEMQADKRIVLAAVISQGSSFKHAAIELRSDRRFVLHVVELAGLALEYVSQELKADRQIVLTAVQENGLSLEWASKELRADRQVVQAAVETHGLALWDAAEELRTDPALLACCNWN
mmetsp:Transcript_45848/g.84088  ORF Transcript_45848/g.84088 Transcript_45848/m.84088 type:complete len:350 (-) Transcript_45848:46-1095(-)